MKKGHSSTSKKNIITVIDVFTNEQKILQTDPQNIQELNEQIRSAFSIPNSVNFFVKDLDNSVINNQNIQETSTFLLYVDEDQDAKQKELKASITVEHEIIPHVSIMIQAGDEYDFITALAEMIDNSIQNTVCNDKDRIIEISMSKSINKYDSEQNSKLVVWDNGRGMNMKGLINWATMGVSASEEVKISKFGEGAQKYLTSDFSRYGVGSKKAIFNIGDNVRMISKVKSSPYVYEAVLSKRRLEQEHAEGNNGWKTEFRTRPPTISEQQWDQFTQIIITDIKDLYIDRYDSISVRRKLAHIYHYYVFGPRGNIEDQQKGDDIDDDIESPFDDCKPFQPVIIKVDGKSLHKHPEDDMETQYLRLGMKPFKFQCKVTAITRDEPDAFSQSATQHSQASTSGSSRSRITSLVNGILFYFPYKNGQETLPIPHWSINLRGDYELSPDDDGIPLSERSPGFECFWNGRLLPGEGIKALPFMKSEKSYREVPDHCFRRVKGMLFLDSAFKVSANKHYLLKDIPLNQALFDYSERSLSLSFRKWIKECHQKLDEEIVFGDIDNSLKEEHKSHVTYFNKVKFGSLDVKKGDKVSVKTRPKVIGEVVAIYRDTSSESYVCFVRISDWNEKISEHMLSKVEKSLSAGEYKEEINKLKKRLPSTIDIVDTLNVPITERTPPIEPKQAGYILKYITVAILSGEGKPISKQNVSITLNIYHEENLIATMKPERATQGLHCFKTYKLKPPEFTIAGKYNFEFSTDFPGVLPKVYHLQITPASPETIKIDATVFNCEIGHFLEPFHLFQCDQYGNTVPFEENLHPGDLKITTSDNDFVLNTNDISLKKADSGIVIENMGIASGKISDPENEDNCQITELVVTYGLLSPAKFKVTVFPGTPNNLILDEESQKIFETKITRPVLPPVKLYLVDSSGNRISTSRLKKNSLTCKAESASFKSTYDVKMKPSSGVFIFDDLTINEISGKIHIRFYVPELEECPAIEKMIVIEQNVRTQAEKKKDSKILEAGCKFYVKLIPAENQSDLVQDIGKVSAKLSISVGQILSGWKVIVFDEKTHEKCRNFSGVCCPSWCNTEDIKLVNGECLLPDLIGPQANKNMKYIIHVTKVPDITDGGEEDPKNLTITFTLDISTRIGTPYQFMITSCPKRITCGAPFKLSLVVQDEFGNKFNLDEDAKLFPSISEIEPICEISSMESAEGDHSENEPSVFIEKEKCKPFEKKGGILKGSIVIGGTAGEVALIVKDKNSIVKDAQVKLSLQHGPPDCLKVNGQKALSLTVLRYSKLPELFVTVHDAYGNRLTDVTHNFEMQVSTDLDLTTLEDSQSSMEVSQDAANGYKLPEMYVLGPFGTHSLVIFSKYENRPTLSCTVTLENVPGKHPREIKILNFEKLANSEVVAGDTLGPIEAKIIAEDGKMIKTPSQLHLEITEPSSADKNGSAKSLHYDSSLILTQVPDHECIYNFPDYAKQLTKSGKYLFTVSLDLRYLEYSSILEEKDLVCKKQLSVKPASPSKIEFDPPDFQLPAISNTADKNELDKRTFWDELNMKIIDKYGNLVENFSGVVTLSVKQCHKDSANINGSQKTLPILEGNVKEKIRKGCTKFGRLSIQDNIGRNGSFLLCFCCEGVPTREIEFCFTDDAKIQQQQKVLNKKKRLISEELEHLKSEIRDSKLAYEEALLKIGNLNRQKEKLVSEINELAPDIPQKCRTLTADSSSKEVDKAISVINTEVAKLKSAEKSKRKAIYNSEDKVLVRICQCLTREQDKSGIVGIVANLGYIDDMKLNKALSSLCGSRMNAVVVRDKKTVDHWRKELETYKSRTAFIPLDNISRPPMDKNNLIAVPNIAKGFDGYIGQAANLIHIRDGEPAIRFVFYALFGDTLVFDTFEKAMKFRKQLLSSGNNVPLIVTLDGERLESMGIVYAGKDKETTYRFGEIPITDTSKYKSVHICRDLLEQLGVLVKQIDSAQEAIEEAQHAEQEIKDKHESAIKKLETSLLSIQNQLRDLMTKGIPAEFDDSEQFLVNIEENDSVTKNDGIIEEFIEKNGINSENSSTNHHNSASSNEKKRKRRRIGISVSDSPPQTPKTPRVQSQKTRSKSSTTASKRGRKPVQEQALLDDDIEHVELELETEQHIQTQANGSPPAKRTRRLKRPGTKKSTTTSPKTQKSTKSARAKQANKKSTPQKRYRGDASPEMFGDDDSNDEDDEGDERSKKRKKQIGRLKCSFIDDEAEEASESEIEDEDELLEDE